MVAGQQVRGALAQTREPDRVLAGKNYVIPTVYDLYTFPQHVWILRRLSWNEDGWHE